MKDEDRLIEIEQSLYALKNRKRKIAVVRNILAFNLLVYILVTLFFYTVVFDGANGPLFLLVWIMFSSILGIWSIIAMSTEVRRLQSKEKLSEFKVLQDEKLTIEFRIYNERMKTKLKESPYGEPNKRV